MKMRSRSPDMGGEDSLAQISSSKPYQDRVETDGGDGGFAFDVEEPSEMQDLHFTVASPKRKWTKGQFGDDFADEDSDDEKKDQDNRDDEEAKSDGSDFEIIDGFGAPKKAEKEAKAYFKFPAPIYPTAIKIGEITGQTRLEQIL